MTSQTFSQRHYNSVSVAGRGAAARVRSSFSSGYVDLSERSMMIVSSSRDQQLPGIGDPQLICKRVDLPGAGCHRHATRELSQPCQGATGTSIRPGPTRGFAVVPVQRASARRGLPASARLRSPACDGRRRLEPGKHVSIHVLGAGGVT